MKNMLILSNSRYCAFFGLNDKSEAIKLRKSDSRMKYARIYSIIQAYPSKIQIGKVYDKQPAPYFPRIFKE